MPDIVTPPKGLLDDYWFEEELAKEAKVSVRYLRKQRQLGQGPPWAKYAHHIIYHKPGSRDWLRSLVIEPVRSRKAA